MRKTPSRVPTCLYIGMPRRELSPPVFDFQMSSSLYVIATASRTPVYSVTDSKRKRLFFAEF